MPQTARLGCALRRRREGLKPGERERVAFSRRHARAFARAERAARLLFGVLLVSLQFVIYTNLRDLLGVSKADLTLVFDALTVLRS